jgi:hypothetical protein
MTWSREWPGESQWCVTHSSEQHYSFCEGGLDEICEEKYRQYMENEGDNIGCVLVEEWPTEEEPSE